VGSVIDDARDPLALTLMGEPLPTVLVGGQKRTCVTLDGQTFLYDTSDDYLGLVPVEDPESPLLSFPAAQIPQNLRATTRKTAIFKSPLWNELSQSLFLLVGPLSKRWMTHSGSSWDQVMGFCSACVGLPALKSSWLPRLKCTSEQFDEAMELMTRLYSVIIRLYDVAPGFVNPSLELALTELSVVWLRCCVLVGVLNLAQLR
jgi:hypothetical protein